MRAVRNTVDTGRTVVCTINQPSIDVFEAFDELFFTKSGGEEVVVEIPYIFFQATFCCLIVYAMISYEWTAVKFVWYLFFTFFSMLYFTLYGMMTVAVTPSYRLASIFSSSFYAIWGLFSGFYMPHPMVLECMFPCMDSVRTGGIAVRRRKGSNQC
ncbi:ABC-2 type transporter [Parasponia andersonii]|uniref:ABC-2 type transporter n=1 Tax=Parasponia andersonii TaxID=3476 RepID=A0A2P5CZA5_PARAD|nr:ABC-2 type transporter [Parasponia andersonii]